MTRFIRVTLLFLAFVLPARAGALRVVATLPDLAAVAREVGGEHVKVTSMSLSTQDPHFVDAKPSLALEMSRADLLLLVGLDLEIGWLPTLLTGARNGRIQKGEQGYLDCSQFVPILEIPTETISRSMGDIHPGGNPHYYFDPRAMDRVAKGISERMVALDPEHADDYRANYEAFSQQLAQARTGWEANLGALSDQPVVAYHKSWPYLEDWLGFHIIEHIEPKPGVPPTPSHAAKVLGTVKQRGVGIILQESFYPSTTSQLIAEKSGARLVVLPGGSDFKDGESYIEHMDAFVRKLAGGA